jgi:hypothetical protein
MSVHSNHPIAVGLNAGGSTLALASSLATPGALWMTSSAGTSVTGLAGSAQGSVPAWHAATGTYLDSSRAWAIGVTVTAGLTLANTTAAAAGAQQYSPSLVLTGQGWKTNATAASQACSWAIASVPQQGAAAPTAILHFLSSVAGGAYTSRLNVDSAGTMTVSVGLQVGSYMNHRGLGAIGLGTSYGFDLSAIDSPVHLMSNSRADAANNIVIASVYDRGAASITNAATMRIHSFGWTNNSDAYAELAAVYGNGRMWSMGSCSAGDLGGLASTTTITNATVADGASDATLGKAPAAAGRSGWLKIYVGTTAVCVPYWPAA